MALSLTLVGLFACLSGALLRFCLGRGVVSATISVVAPLALYLTHFFYFRILDPFGFWSVELTFGFIIFLFASAFGIVLAAQIARKPPKRTSD